ncbi:DUF2884 family protein [Solimonas flava]|uniref:DUF2884 family protein n=1 Tax=Solimonas flava TaxID=415849 RepID=UPI0004274523|nr:DUF2884 family protein [Solimonas flava]
MSQPLALAPLALLAAVLAWPGAARAADDGCRCELRADIRLDGDAVELRGDDARYRLEGDRVFRDGRELQLDATQHRTADDYRRGLQRMVPAVSEIAIDGAMLGLEAVTVSFAALGGDRHDLRQYEKRMTTLSEHIHARYNGRELLRGSLGGDADDEGLDAEIDALAEDLAADMTGNIASMVFTALVNPSRIEARADATERIVERRIQPKADALEAKARPLCAQFARLDALERTLGIDAIDVEPGAASPKTRARRGFALFSF